jgi:hypothetical protein
LLTEAAGRRVGRIQKSKIKIQNQNSKSKSKSKFKFKIKIQNSKFKIPTLSRKAREGWGTPQHPMTIFLRQARQRL